MGSVETGDDPYLPPFQATKPEPSMEPPAVLWRGRKHSVTPVLPPIVTGVPRKGASSKTQPPGVGLVHDTDIGAADPTLVNGTDPNFG